MNDKSTAMALIIMTSYNGDRYIAQQLQSIVNQDYTNWRLLIRDDGSTDGTLDVIRRFCARDSRIELLENDTGRHGAYLNFWTLIRLVRERHEDCDYYFFADQDDVWDRGKIGAMIEHAETRNIGDAPLLLYADMRVIDGDGKRLMESLDAVMGIGDMRGYSLFFTHGFLWGCDICVNRRLFQQMPVVPTDHPQIDIVAHDNFMGKYALITGQVRYMKVPLIDHRRHGDNTTGGYMMKLSLGKSLRRFFIQYNDLVKTHARVYNQTLVFIDLMRRQGFTDGVLNEIETVIRTGGVKGMLRLKKLGVYRKQRSRGLGIYLIILTGAYKKWLVL